jgi:predicted RNase H-like nuclease
MLGWPRSGAIASAPARRALGFASYADAAAANGGHLSAISWRVIKRVEEVEADMAPYLQRTVFEVHPELSFYQLNDDRPVRFSKHLQSGKQERRGLLEKRFPGVERILDVRTQGITLAQLLDATACLWTARRIISRSVDRLPQDPEWDAKGLRMEIIR